MRKLPVDKLLGRMIDPSSPLARGLVLACPMSEGGGTTINNLVKPGESGTSSAWGPGQWGPCQSFNGFSYATIPATSLMSLSSGTVSCWANPTFASSGTIWANNTDSSTNRQFNLGTQAYTPTLIGNASFETPSTGGSFIYSPTGGTWTFSGGAGLAAYGSAFAPPAPPSGSQVAFLQGTGYMSQDVTLPAGTYTMTFYSAQRSGNSQNFSVSVDGTSVGTYTPSGFFGFYGTSSFTVTAGTHTILFQGINTAGGDNTAFVDLVNLYDANVGFHKYQMIALNSAGALIYITQTDNYFRNGWHHVVYASTSGAGGHSLFVDGIRQTFTASSGSAIDFFFADVLVSGDSLQLGAKSDVSNLHVTYLTGSVDNLLIYNRELKDAEVQRLYTDPFCYLARGRRRLFVSSGSSSSAAGTAAGDSTASAVGRAIIARAGTAAGDSTAAGVGRSTASSVGTASGDSTAAGVGRAVIARAGTAAGDSTAAGVGRSTSNSVGTAAGDSTAAGVGRSTASSVGTAAGDSTAAGVARSIIARAGTAAGDSTAAGVGRSTVSRAGTAAGDSTASGVGRSTASAVGTAAGSSTATGVSSSPGSGTGTAAGDSTATAVGRSLASSVGSAAGNSTATAVGRAVWSVVGTAPGDSSASGVGRAVWSVVGTAPGSSSATGVGRAVITAVGTAAGSSTASAVSTSGATATHHGGTWDVDDRPLTWDVDRSKTWEVDDRPLTWEVSRR